ncbi:hypothetical protein AB0O75_39530 [Streptomyces sp. NPDC088921]|uniref:hypothetical protein n=1 Tax=unclassified Streptomyces TaxID=2593676 RepID=UPI00342DAEFB
MTETTLRQNMSGEICCESQGPRTIAGEVHAAILDADADAEFGMRGMGARITVSGYHRCPVEAGRGEVSSSRHEFTEREALIVFALYAGPGTEITFGWRHTGDPEKRVRVTVAPAATKADRRRLRLRAAV